jgi:uncharacterized protein (TIGR03067 family)
MNDLDLMQGTWNLVSAMENGKALPENEVKQTTIVVKGNTFRFPGLAEDATARAGTFKLDATKNPREMDSTSDEKEVSLGIYELESDSYKIVSLRRASRVPPNSVPSPAVVKFSKFGSDKRRTEKAAPCFLVASVCLARVRPISL